MKKIHPKVKELKEKISILEWYLDQKFLSFPDGICGYYYRIANYTDKYFTIAFKKPLISKILFGFCAPYWFPRNKFGDFLRVWYLKNQLRKCRNELENIVSK